MIIFNIKVVDWYEFKNKDNVKNISKLCRDNFKNKNKKKIFTVSS